MRSCRTRAKTAANTVVVRYINGYDSGARRRQSFKQLFRHSRKAPSRISLPRFVAAAERCGSRERETTRTATPVTGPSLPDTERIRRIRSARTQKLGHAAEGGNSQPATRRHAIRIAPTLFGRRIAKHTLTTVVTRRTASHSAELVQSIAINSRTEAREQGSCTRNQPANCRDEITVKEPTPASRKVVTHENADLRRPAPAVQIYRTQSCRSVRNPLSRNPKDRHHTVTRKIVINRHCRKVLCPAPAYRVSAKCLEVK